MERFWSNLAVYIPKTRKMSKENRRMIIYEAVQHFVRSKMENIGITIFNKQQTAFSKYQDAKSKLNGKTYKDIEDRWNVMNLVGENNFKSAHKIEKIVKASYMSESTANFQYILNFVELFKIKNAIPNSKKVTEIECLLESLEEKYHFVRPSGMSDPKVQMVLELMKRYTRTRLIDNIRSKLSLISFNQSI